MRIIFFLLLAVSAQAQTQLYGTTIINATSGLQLPVGNDSQRPPAQFGMIRANTESGGIEVYDGSWQKATYFTGGLDKNVSIVYDGSGWVTEAPVYGEAYGTSLGNASLTTTFSIVPINTSGLLSSFERDGTALKYVGTIPIAVLVSYEVNYEFGAADDNFKIRVRQNSTSVAKSERLAQTGYGSDLHNVAGSCILTLQPNDLIRLEHATNVALGVTVTMHQVNLTITKI